MTTTKKGKSKATTPQVKVVDLGPNAVETGKSVDGKNNPKGGAEVRRYDIDQTFIKGRATIFSCAKTTTSGRELRADVGSALRRAQ